MEEKLASTLGTRVHIERRDNGGKVSIDFFSNDDLRTIIDLLKSNEKRQPTELMDRFIKNKNETSAAAALSTSVPVTDSAEAEKSTMPETAPEDKGPIDDRTKTEVQEDEEALYSIKNFSL